MLLRGSVLTYTFSWELLVEERSMECFPLSFCSIWREERRKSVGGADPFSTIWMLVMAVYFLNWSSSFITFIPNLLMRETSRPRWWWTYLWTAALAAVVSMKFWLHFLPDSHLTKNSENMVHLAKAFTSIPIYLLMSLLLWTWYWWI